MKTVNFVIFALIGSALIANIGPAYALRPTISKPSQCKGYIHSEAGKATNIATAKQRARGKWQRRASFEAGRKFRSWNLSVDKHYDCDKHGKWYHCLAATYPCKTSF
jgi:hypothetical protein